MVSNVSEIKTKFSRLRKKTKRGNFDKPRILRYGFLKAHEEHHDGKGHRTLICYDKQEHCFVRLKHDFVSSHGVTFVMVVVCILPFFNSFTNWLSEFHIIFHWWMWLIAIIIGLIGYEANRRNDAAQFEKVEPSMEVINSHVKYCLLYILGFVPLDLILLSTIHWGQYPYLQLDDIITIFALVYVNTIYIYLILEGLYVRIRYVR